MNTDDAGKINDVDALDDATCESLADLMDHGHAELIMVDGEVHVQLTEMGIEWIQSFNEKVH